MTPRQRRTLLLTVTFAGAMCSVGLAAAAAPVAPPPPPAPPPPSTSESAPPSLDDLLGLERDADDGAEEAARERQEALRRRLTEAEKRDAFLSAVDDMDRSAELLGERGETGIATQRLQEEILERLETLLRQPPRRNSSNPSSSDDQPPPQNDPRQAPAQPQATPGSEQAAEQAAEDSSPGGTPPGDATLLERALEESGAEWGNLPDRVRDMIRQGLRERPSSLYERLTESYYRRLAEESSR